MYTTTRPYSVHAFILQQMFIEWLPCARLSATCEDSTGNSRHRANLHGAASLAGERDGPSLTVSLAQGPIAFRTLAHHPMQSANDTHT